MTSEETRTWLGDWARSAHALRDQVDTLAKENLRLLGELHAAGNARGPLLAEADALRGQLALRDHEIAGKEKVIEDLSAENARLRTALRDATKDDDEPPVGAVVLDRDGDVWQHLGTGDPDDWKCRSVNGELFFPYRDVVSFYGPVTRLIAEPDVDWLTDQLRIVLQRRFGVFGSLIDYRDGAVALLDAIRSRR